MCVWLVSLPRPLISPPCLLLVDSCTDGLSCTVFFNNLSPCNSILVTFRVQTYKHLIQFSDLSHLSHIVQVNQMIKNNVLMHDKPLSDKNKAWYLKSLVRRSHSLTQNCTDFLIVPDTSPTVLVVPPQSGLVTFMVSHRNTKRAQGREWDFVRLHLIRLPCSFFPLQRCKAPAHLP